MREMGAGGKLSGFISMHVIACRTSSLPRQTQVSWEFWTNSNDECGVTCDEQIAFVKVRGADQGPDAPMQITAADISRRSSEDPHPDIAPMSFPGHTIFRV